MSFEPICLDWIGFAVSCRLGQGRTGTVTPSGSKPSACIQTCLRSNVSRACHKLTHTSNNRSTQMSCGDQPVATLVSWSAADQHTRVPFFSIDSCECLSARKTREFHKLCRETEAKS